jgi:hypothetical protein
MDIVSAVQAELDTHLVALVVKHLEMMQGQPQEVMVAKTMLTHQ